MASWNLFYSGLNGFSIETPPYFIQKMQKRYIDVFRPRGNVDFAVGKANLEIFL